MQTELARPPVTSHLAIADLERVRHFPLVLIRGIPGVGKSTLARHAFGSRFLVEADQFFLTAAGVYHWQRHHASVAHAWCLKTTAAHLDCGHQVVVANTFVTRIELAAYFRLGRRLSWHHDIAVLMLPHVHLPLEALAQRTQASGHDVPLAVLARMAATWEPCEGEYLLTPEVPHAPTP
jgi:predicted kinase